MSIGERLKEVREELKMTQTEFAEVAASLGAPGATRQSQAKYEKGKSVPSAAYIAAIAGVGADINYILLGERAMPVPAIETLPAEEQVLLDAYRALDVKQQKALLASLLTGQAPSAKKPSKSTVKTSVKGKSNSVKTVGGDLIGKM